MNFKPAEREYLELGELRKSINRRKESLLCRYSLIIRELVGDKLMKKLKR